MLALIGDGFLGETHRQDSHARRRASSVLFVRVLPAENHGGRGELVHAHGADGAARTGGSDNDIGLSRTSSSWWSSERFKSWFL